MYPYSLLLEAIMNTAAQDDSQSQLDKFKEAAREHEADEDEAHWDERLKKVVKQKPAPNGSAD
tara:strand:- start:136043 stop:136231 length:189 start_codon:yes stop_codon:yes gene_type:complete